MTVFQLKTKNVPQSIPVSSFSLHSTSLPLSLRYRCLTVTVNGVLHCMLYNARLHLKNLRVWSWWPSNRRPWSGSGKSTTTTFERPHPLLFLLPWHLLLIQLHLQPPPQHQYNTLSMMNTAFSMRPEWMNGCTSKTPTTTTIIRQWNISKPDMLKVLEPVRSWMCYSCTSSTAAA